MKILRQVLVLTVVSLLGELLKALLPLPFPASIYGLILLFLALQTGVVRLEDVKTVSEFLISIMPIMFIPPAVGLMESWGLLEELWLPVVLVGVVTTFLIMASTGLTTQLVITRSRKKGGGQRD